MAVEIDTATDHEDLFDRLRAFLQLGITTPGGPDWTLLRYDSVNKRALFQAPGLTSTEEIGVGISLHEDIPGDTFAIGFWMFRSYNALLGDLEQPGMGTVVYLPLWDTAMPYWFIANGQRVIVVAKVSTTYQAAYAGKFLPFGTPGEYPQPYYVGAPVTLATTRWSTIVEGDRAFFDPGDSAYILLPGSGQWRNVQNFDVGTGNSEADKANSNYVWPFTTSAMSTSTKTRYRELRENVDGTYWLMPLTLTGSDPDDDTWGDLDGVFAVTGFSNASENLVQIGADDYLVVQDMHRTARHHYAAIKLE